MPGNEMSARGCNLKYSLGAQFLQNNFFVNDGLGGSNSSVTAFEIQWQIIQILNSEDFKLKSGVQIPQNDLKNIAAD